MNDARGGDASGAESGAIANADPPAQPTDERLAARDWVSIISQGCVLGALLFVIGLGVVLAVVIVWLGPGAFGERP